MHAAHFDRAGKWVGGDEPAGYARRFGLCCGHCRRRRLVPSVRFLPRRWYRLVVVALTSAWAGCWSRWVRGALRAHLGVSGKTVRRWRRWWTEVLPETPAWQHLRGCLPPTSRTEDLPCSLLEVWGVTSEDPLERIVASVGTMARALAMADMDHAVP